MKNAISLLLATLLLAACATTAEYGRQVVDYGRQAGSWIGQKVESLYATEGEPSSVEAQADGGSIIQYQKGQPTAGPAQAAGKDAQPGAPAMNSGAPQAESGAKTATAGNAKVVPCTTRYRTDSSGTIRSWTIDGAGCKAVEEETSPHP